MASAQRKSAAKTVAPPKAKRADWDAIERDYRTAKFTLRELEAKHGVFNTSIARKAKSAGWTQDLSLAIKQATNIKLTQESVSNLVSSGLQDVSNTVLAAAEVNTRIIQGHRTRLAGLSEVVETAKAKLMLLGDTVADIREAATFVQAVGNLATATKTLIEQERKAHNLDDDTTPDDSKDKHTVEVVFV